MERRADPGSRLDSDLDPSARESSKTWQAVRRALGRLVSHVRVRGVEEDARTITPQVLPGDLAVPLPPLPSGSWKPSASVRAAPVPPLAGAGLRESALAPSVTLAAGDCALSPPEVYTMPIAGLDLRIDGVALEWPASVTRLPDDFLRLPASPARTQPVALLTGPKTAALRGWPVPVPRTHLLRLPRFPDPRVRWGGDSVLRRMPLTRRSRALGASGAGRRRLAETVHLGPDEVTLLGVYPDVPILAVERIVVEDEGRQLRLWLKPDVLRGRSGSHRITLLVGRQTATGKMLQAAL